MKFLFSIFMILIISTAAQADEKTDQQIDDLGKYIGGYPPRITSEAQKQEVITKYKTLKIQLDKQLEARPDDLTALRYRGMLQVMGHNLDLPNSWEGADNDFTKILKIDPKNEEALERQGQLYVNSDPSLAAKAQKMFEKAQMLHGTELAEQAQQGLFFAYYYQGHICKAYNQAQLLVRKWPDHGYQGAVKTSGAVVERKKLDCSK